MDHSPEFLKLADAAQARVKRATIQTLKKKLDDKESFVLVDVREDNEWAKGRIPGAVHMSRGIIERDIEKRFPDKKTELLLYCGGGFRSALSAESLNKMGYSNATSVDGGWRGWTEAGYPVENK